MERTVSGVMLRDMILTGAALLEKNRAYIDSLNVFPVPDGDTGTNMSMTMQGAVRELKSLSANNVSVSDIAKAVSLGSLKGARGNSGVILSQVFRGFAKALSGASEMDGVMFANALKAGTEAAYKAVMKPKEGTVLTVVREMSEAAKKAADEGKSAYDLIDVMLESGEVSLKRTPDLLPVLKEAGVVDSGGKGLVTIFRGFKMSVDGEGIDEILTDNAQNTETIENDNAVVENAEDIEFGYCTEFFIIHLSESFTEADLDKLREKLMKIGDSVVVAYDTGFIKIHVHSNYPGKIIQLALKLGEVDKIKIENMREQNREIQENLKKNEKEIAMVAVSSGDGISEVFTELAVSAVIAGGQTMNPSIDVIGKAIRKANARNVIILPNNSNIIMAAQQAAELSDKNVLVIPSKTMVQGITAATAFDFDADANTNAENMTAALENVVSGSVTYAVRDTQVNGTHIEKGNIIGLLDNKIVEVGESVDGTARALLRKMMEQHPDDPVVTVFYGENMDAENANMLVSEMEAEYPDAEFAVQNGGQPLYYYYFSVE